MSCERLVGHLSVSPFLQPSLLPLASHNHRLTPSDSPQAAISLPLLAVWLDQLSRSTTTGWERDKVRRVAGSSAISRSSEHLNAIIGRGFLSHDNRGALFIIS